MVKEIYCTERLTLKLSKEEFSHLVLSYYIKNKEFLEEYEPSRDNTFFTDRFQKAILKNYTSQADEDLSYRFWISKKENNEEIIGSISISNIIRGPFQSAYIGYKLDKENINRGYMTEALEKIIEIAFEDLDLHRIEANIMPRNKSSLKVVSKLGFENEGLGKKYLKINDIWEDHIHMVLIKEEK